MCKPLMHFPCCTGLTWVQCCPPRSRLVVALGLGQSRPQGHSEPASLARTVQRNLSTSTWAAFWSIDPPQLFDMAFGRLPVGYNAFHLVCHSLSCDTVQGGGNWGHNALICSKLQAPAESHSGKAFFFGLAERHGFPAATEEEDELPPGASACCLPLPDF